VATASTPRSRASLIFGAFAHISSPGTRTVFVRTTQTPAPVVVHTTRTTDSPVLVRTTQTTTQTDSPVLVRTTQTTLAP
jgi:hypothetical protein